MSEERDPMWYWKQNHRPFHLVPEIINAGNPSGDPVPGPFGRAQPCPWKDRFFRLLSRPPLSRIVSRRAYYLLLDLITDNNGWRPLSMRTERG